MANTLQVSVAATGTDYTIDIIRAELNTPSGASRVWVVAEDKDDVDVYEKFVHEGVRVLPSTDYPAGEKGCEHVEQIVRNILLINPNAGVIGIRDRDYTRYELPSHVFPDNVFATDERDVEMMLFHSPSVRASLNNWSGQMLSKLDEAISYTRYMGYLRICNYICKLGCNFKRRVKLQSTWDCDTHRFADDWKAQLTQAFLNNSNNNNPVRYITDKESLDEFVEERELDKEPFQNVCQGHDTVWALSVLMIQNTTYSETKIMRRMTESYSLGDFQQTQLHKDILAWTKLKEKRVFL